jgi:hypothetical protein
MVQSFFGKYLGSSMALIASHVGVASFAYAGSVTAGDRRMPPAARFEFISIGAGIDGDFLKALNATASSYVRKGLVVEYSKRGLEGAFEGETNVCIEMIDANTMQKFYTSLYKLGKPKDTVKIESQRTCNTNPIN